MVVQVDDSVIEVPEEDGSYDICCFAGSVVFMMLMLTMA